MLRASAALLSLLLALPQGVLAQVAPIVAGEAPFAGPVPVLAPLSLLSERVRPDAPAQLPAMSLESLALAPLARPAQGVPGRASASTAAGSRSAGSAARVPAGFLLKPSALGASSRAPRPAAAASRLPGATLPEKVWKAAEALGFSGREAGAAPDGLNAVEEPSGPSSGKTPSVPSSPAPAPKAEAVPQPLPAPGLASRPVFGFLGNLVFIQLGVEAFGLAVPQLAKSLSNSFWALSGIATVAFTAYMVGNFVAGPAVDRLGVRRVYVASLALRTLASTALAGLYHAGQLGLPALVAMYGLDYLLLGASRIAEAAYPIRLFGSAQLPLNRFGTWAQVIIEGIGIIGPLAAGAAVAAHGFGAVLYAYPVLFLASTLISAAFVRTPEGTRGAAGGEKASNRASLKEAARVLFTRPLLRNAFIGFTIDTALTYFLYMMIAPAYGIYASGGAPRGAAINAVITSLYAAGGFAATWLNVALSARLAKRVAARPESERAAAERSGFLRNSAFWMAASAAALLGGWTLLLKAPWLGFIHPYLFMLPFGLTGVMAYLHLDTLVKSEAPPEMQGTVLGLVRALSSLAAVGGFFLLGFVFQRFSVLIGATAVPTAGAFVALGLLLTVAAAVYLLVARSFLQSSRR